MTSGGSSLIRYLKLKLSPSSQLSPGLCYSTAFSEATLSCPPSTIHPTQVCFTSIPRNNPLPPFYCLASPLPTSDEKKHVGVAYTCMACLSLGVFKPEMEHFSSVFRQKSNLNSSVALPLT